MSRILDVQAVCERTGIARRTVYTEVSEGRFPRPVQLTSRRVGWVEEEVDDWIAARIAKRDEVTA